MLERLKRTYFAVFREYPPLLNLAVITLASQLAFGLLNFYALPVYLVQDLGVSGLALGAASTTFLAIEMVLKLPMGRLSDRVGRKPLIMLGPLLVCLNPTLIVSLPARVWALVFPLRAVDGAGAAALWPPLYAMVGDLVRDRSRATAMAVVHTVYIAALGLAAVVGSLSAHFAHSDRFPFYLASGLLALSGLVAHFGLPQTRGYAGEPHTEISPLGGAMEPEPAPPPAAARAAPYPVALILLMGLLMTMGLLMLSNFLILYAKVELGMTTLHIGVLLAVFGAPMVLLGLPLGRLSDRWGKARAVRFAVVVSAIMMWLMPFPRTVVTFALVGAPLVLSQILGMPAWLGLVSQLAPTSRRGGIMGLVATAEGIGAAAAPLLGGVLWDISPPYIFFGSAAVLTLAAAVALFTLRREPPGMSAG